MNAPVGTYMCPLCGQASPHTHKPIQEIGAVLDDIDSRINRLALHSQERSCYREAIAELRRLLDILHSPGIRGEEGGSDG